jgi:hypothetical protein
MDYRTKFKKNKIAFIITVGILGLALGWTIGMQLDFLKTKEQLLLPKPIPYADTIKIEGFSENKLIEFMKLVEMEYPDIVLAQAKLESGNFTSNRFIKYNALFGFQKSESNIIKYKSWKESVIHYKCWQMNRLKEDENYYNFLIRVKYASDTNYINKLKQFKDA